VRQSGAHGPKSADRPPGCTETTRARARCPSAGKRKKKEKKFKKLKKKLKNSKNSKKKKLKKKKKKKKKKI
jgi:hypothetical protein